MKPDVIFGTKHHAPIAAVIKSQVRKFDDKRLNDDDLFAREAEYRRATAELANAICDAFKDHSTKFDVAKFAAACGLYVSDGRDTHSDCSPGQLTWEKPATAAPARVPTTPKEKLEALVESTSDAYSFNRYMSWKACASALRNRGYNDMQVAAILRSKITRWAADQKAYSRSSLATSADLIRFMDAHPKDVKAVLEEGGAL